MKVLLQPRKQLRLEGYDYSNNGYYFITICTQNRQKTFGNSVGATLCGRPPSPCEMVEKWLLELQNKFHDVTICEYVIMPDHVHFIIAKFCESCAITGDHAGSPLQDIVGWFKTMTTNDYIKNVKNNYFPPFDKKLWQRGYYEHIIRNEYDYDAIARYIINNPTIKHNDNDIR